MKRISLWLLTLLLSVSAYAQSYMLKGTVEDQTGEPLIGASVRNLTSNTGVTTDVDGNFQIPVKNGDKVEISYVGCLAETLTANGQNNIKVVLKENSESLEEVVVIGYGTMKKKDLTGSVVAIDPAKIADQNPGNVQDLLRGTPGLQIGYDASAKGGGSIQLRGQNSVYTKGDHNSPLIVLDGMIFYGELSEVNPDDIERIDVLKDASSTAIYGARAASGVIIITTKRGKEGKPMINFSANLGVNTKSAYRDVYDAAGQLAQREEYYRATTYGFNPTTGAYEAYQAVDGKGNLIRPAGYYDHYSNLGRYGIDQNTWAAYGTNPAGASMNEIYFRRLFDMGEVSEEVLQNYLAGRTYNWYKDTFRTGLNQDYNVSISGAGERYNYYFSFGYLKNEGAVRGNDYRAYRSNLKILSKITNWLEFSANVNFQDRTDGDIQVDLGTNYWDANMLRNSPYANKYTLDGQLAQYPMGADKKAGYNYDFERQYKKLDKGYTTLNTIFTARVLLPFGFTYQFNIAPRFQWFHDRYFESAAHPDWLAKDHGVNRENTKTFDWSLNNTVTWDRTFNDKHHFTVTLVQEAEENRYWKDRIEARNILPSDALGFHNINNATMADSKFSNNDKHFTADAWLGRLFYSFDEKYMITVAARRDGYCAFGQNYPHATFPSVALGWTFTNEKFMEQYASWFNMGKLRLSWGKNGNRSLEDPYISMANLGSGQGATMTYLDKNGKIIEDVKYLMMDRLANPNLQWEKTSAYNVGLDLSFLNYRINANIDWYYKKTDDMIMEMSLPGFSGFGSIWTNIGQVDNTGIEISLSTRNIVTRDFQWTTTAGFSYNKNRIKHLKGTMEEILDDNGNIIGQREASETASKLYINKPIGEIWDYQFDGIWSVAEAAEAARHGQRPGDPKVRNNYTKDDIVNADGTVTPVYNDKDKVYLGTTNPPIYWNLGNEFKFKNNLTFAFSFYSYMGHKSTETTYMNGLNGGSLYTKGFNMFKQDYWTPDNQTNEYGRFESQGPSGVSYPGKLHNRSFVRLDNISIGYTLPEAWTRKAAISKCRFTASVRNVCTIGGDWEYGDPETGGLATRTYNFGLQLSF